MRSVKTFVSILLALIIALAMVACQAVPAEEAPAQTDAAEKPETEPSNETPSEEPSESKLVYCIAASRENAYFDAIYSFAEKVGRELGYEVVSVSHDDDIQKQQELFDAAVAAGAVAIICDNAGSDASIETVRGAVEAGVPVFLVDREINENGVALSQITADNYGGAVAGAEYFVEVMGEKGEYAELMGLESDTIAGIRSMGYHEVIDQYADMVMVAQQSANWSRTEAYDKTEAILQAHPNLKGIVAGNDDMALGAAAACQAAGRSDIFIIGFDGTDEAVQAVVNGQLAATIMDQVGISVQTAFELMEKYLTTGSTGADEKQLVSCLLVTPDNASKVHNFSLEN
jgi:erythritol transport system substrate-binding protein